MVSEDGVGYYVKERVCKAYWKRGRFLSGFQDCVIVLHTASVEQPFPVCCWICSVSLIFSSASEWKRRKETLSNTWEMVVEKMRQTDIAEITISCVGMGLKCRTVTPEILSLQMSFFSDELLSILSFCHILCLKVRIFLCWALSIWFSCLLTHVISLLSEEEEEGKKWEHNYAPFSFVFENDINN